MELIVDNIQVITVDHWRMNKILRYIDIDGHLSKNFFPFVVHSSVSYPNGEPYYPPPMKIVSPISSNFKLRIEITENLRKEPIHREGIYKIKMQGSWTPFILIPATPEVEIEVDTRGREDRRSKYPPWE